MHTNTTLWSLAGACLLAASAAVRAVDLGPNVLVFDPTQGDASIQAQLDTVFAAQQRTGARVNYIFIAALIG